MKVVPRVVNTFPAIADTGIVAPFPPLWVDREELERKRRTDDPTFHVAKLGADFK